MILLEDQEEEEEVVEEWTETRTNTSIEVSFKFNNNLDPPDREVLMEEVPDIVNWEEGDIVLLEEEEWDVSCILTRQIQYKTN